MASIVQTLASDNRFSTLAQAIQTSGVDETLRAAGPYTLFAPTNAAFDALDEEERDRLLGNAGRLRQVLEYHILPARLNWAFLIRSTTGNTLQGERLQFTFELQAGGSPTDVRTAYVNRAPIVGREIRATNGVIYPIEGILVPPERYSPQGPPPAKGTPGAGEPPPADVGPTDQ